jgi:DNA-binding MarR family transcriptional regulator
MLAESGATTQRDLAAAVRLDPSNLVGLLNELEAGGLVSRRRSAADRRRHIVELTGRGHAVLGEALGALRAVEDEMLGCLDRRRRDALADLLQRAIGDAIPCSIPPGDAEAAGP